MHVPKLVATLTPLTRDRGCPQMVDDKERKRAKHIDKGKNSKVSLHEIWGTAEVFIRECDLRDRLLRV